MSEKNAPNLTPHTLTRYDEDLNALRSLLMNMGGVAEQHFGDALAYLLDGDAERGRVAMEKDYEIDQLEVSIDELSIHLIARYAPTAGDLRTIMAIVKAITDLERVGDKSEKLARIAEEVGPALQTTEFATHFRVMGRIVKGMLHDALDAFVRQDCIAAEEIIRRDDHVNHEYNEVHGVLLRFMREHPDMPDLSLRMLHCMRMIERIGDHCTNIAEYIIFEQRGTSDSAAGLDESKERTQI
ncbi:MAG: phosphate signaling complex protein PhoU [Halothiobacillaceae bacterium]|nr:phosphate signaling complex protein PhoU [Halothiobacillaceae bacterium]